MSSRSAFAGVVWAWQGGGPATEYITGYLIERSLSIDNVFVLAVIFTYFAVPAEFRHRALLLGVLGALVLRAVFIAGGAIALERVAWSIYVLGAFLVLTGARLAVSELEAHPDKNVALRMLRRIVPMTHGFHGQRFFIRHGPKLLATPMLAVLVAIATTDVAFAADSVPAIFAVTDNTFLVFAANAFSVLGMLALFFLLAGAMERFRYLRPALAAVLVFVGAKMLLSGHYHLPAALSLAVILSILAIAAAASVVVERSPRPLSAGASRVPAEEPTRPAPVRHVAMSVDTAAIPPTGPRRKR